MGLCRFVVVVRGCWSFAFQLRFAGMSLVHLARGAISDRCVGLAPVDQYRLWVERFITLEYRTISDGCGRFGRVRGEGRHCEREAQPAGQCRWNSMQARQRRRTSVPVSSRNSRKAGTEVSRNRLGGFRGPASRRTGLAGKRVASDYFCSARIHMARRSATPHRQDRPIERSRLPVISTGSGMSCVDRRRAVFDRAFAETTQSAGIRPSHHCLADGGVATPAYWR